MHKFIDYIIYGAQFFKKKILADIRVSKIRQRITVDGLLYYL